MTADEIPGAPRGARAMAVVRWLLVAAVALVAAGSTLAYFGLLPGSASSSAQSDGRRYYCPMHPQIVQDRPGECPICHMALVPRKPGAPAAAPAAVAPAAVPATGKYYCPMHPQVTSDDPEARCSLCGGMKLVPRPAQATAGPPPDAGGVPGLVAVDLPLERVQKIGVRSERVTRQSVAGDLRAVGVVEADERGLASISARFSGWIESLLVAETGQQVKRGQALATVYSPEVLQAQQELLTALGWNAGAAGSAQQHHAESAPLAGLVADARHRLELLGISPQEIEEIARTRRPHRAITIRSPVAGHVITKNAVLGKSVVAGAPLFEVADLSSVWVVAEVFESDLPRVRVGQPARFQVSAYPGEVFRGKVKFLSPTLDVGSRTLRARLEFKNRGGPAGLRLRPGMYGDVLLDLPPTTGLLAPAEAVVDTGDVQYVFVVKEGGRFEPRRVKVGARLGDRVEIVHGLEEGATVVTTANFLIDSESRLRAAVEGEAHGGQR